MRGEVPLLLLLGVWHGVEAILYFRDKRFLVFDWPIFCFVSVYLSSKLETFVSAWIETRVCPTTWDDGRCHMISGLFRSLAFNGVEASWSELSITDCIHEDTYDDVSFRGCEWLQIGVICGYPSTEFQPVTPAASVLGVCCQVNSRFLGTNCASEPIQEKQGWKGCYQEILRE